MNDRSVSSRAARDDAGASGSAGSTPTSIDDTAVSGSYFVRHAEDILSPMFISSGFPALDRALGGGFRAGSLAILAGHTGSGRTALATQIALQAAQTPGSGPILFLSFEMTADETAVRLIMQSTPLLDGYAPPLGFSERDRPAARAALETLARLPLVLDDWIAPSVAAVEAGIGLMDRRPSLLVIDKLGLMSSAASADNHRALQAGIVAELRAMARRLRIAVLLVTDVNRPKPGTTPTAPTLADLPAATIEQEASVILLLHNPAYYASDREQRRAWMEAGAPVTVAIAKNRYGFLGSVTLIFTADRLIFRSADDEVATPRS